MTRKLYRLLAEELHHYIYPVLTNFMQSLQRNIFVSIIIMFIMLTRLCLVRRMIPCLLCMKFMVINYIISVIGRTVSITVLIIFIYTNLINWQIFLKLH